MLARDLAAPAVVRFGSLEPRWTTSRATEPGFFRWLVSYLGGPPGHVNPSPESGITSDGAVVGVMGIPAGNRQHGFHTHTVAEIYVVLRGSLRSRGPRTDHLAGELDCIVIPAGVAHGVEAVGDSDAVFLWLHDAVEPAGTAVYYDSLDDPPPTGDEIRLVSWKSLPVTRDDTEGGYVQTRRTWLDGGLGIESLELAAASRSRTALAAAPVVAVVVAGGARCGDAELGLLDAVVVPPGSEHWFSAGPLAPAHLAVVRGMR